jgi:hypothetical protein
MRNSKIARSDKRASRRLGQMQQEFFMEFNLQQQHRKDQTKDAPEEG